jgi:hypothetical protein
MRTPMGKLCSRLRILESSLRAWTSRFSSRRNRGNKAASMRRERPSRKGSYFSTISGFSTMAALILALEWRSMIPTRLRLRLHRTSRNSESERGAPVAFRSASALLADRNAEASFSSCGQLFCFIQVRVFDEQAQRLALEEAFVGALGSADKRVVRSLFDHAALIENEDAVEHPHRR